MMNFFDEVKEKINKKINPENIILIDNSHLHTQHKSFDPQKLHLKVIIKSKTGRIDNFEVRSFNIKAGNCLMYYPESNGLISRDLDPQSKTPGFKYTKVDVTPVN